MATTRIPPRIASSRLSTHVFYSPRQAADLMGRSEAEVLELIRAGRLRASFMANVGNYIITRDDLTSFLKFSSESATLKGMATHRILLVDRDPKIQDSLKFELGRKGCELKVATTEREIGHLLEGYRPHVMCVHLGATTRATDSVGPSLGRARRLCRTFIVLYHDYKTDPTLDAELSSKLGSLESDVVLSVARSIRPLIDTIQTRLGLIH